MDEHARVAVAIRLEVLENCRTTIWLVSSARVCFESMLVVGMCNITLKLCKWKIHRVHLAKLMRHAVGRGSDTALHLKPETCLLRSCSHIVSKSIDWIGNPKARRKIVGLFFADEGDCLPSDRS